MSSKSRHTTYHYGDCCVCKCGVICHQRGEYKTFNQIDVKPLNDERCVCECGFINHEGYNYNVDTSYPILRTTSGLFAGGSVVAAGYAAVSSGETRQKSMSLAVGLGFLCLFNEALLWGVKLYNTSK